ncbi:MAG: biopolymer transporter ExbD, partial [Thermoanaerobaculia bacterium]
MNVSEKTAVRSEINVTPLVDVCLVLLIIFMVVTPLITKQADVQLPKTPGPREIPEPPRLVKVAILESGAIRVN